MDERYAERIALALVALHAEKPAMLGTTRPAGGKRVAHGGKTVAGIRTIVTTRDEITLETPSNLGELHKAIALAGARFLERTGRNAHLDDDIKVKFVGTEIVLWFDVDRTE